MTARATTEDRLLGGRVILRQPAEGYRAAIDPVLLAAAVPLRDRHCALDLGAGAGAAALCLAARVPGADVTGLEIDAALVNLANENANANGWAARVRFVAGDVAAPPRVLKSGTFDAVFANPPYLEDGAGTLSPSAGRRRANAGGPPLAAWAAAALRLVKPRGVVAFIHRADRIDGVIAALAGKAGALEIIPLWPRAGEAARRVIVRARQGAKGGAALLPGLILHGDGGKYSEAAERVLRGEAGLFV